MCDYSLFAHPNRLANEGERLVVYRFSSTSVGLASPADVTASQPAQCPGAWRKWFSWSAIRDWLNSPEPAHPVPAVCIPPGARLMVRDIGRDLQRELGVGAEEEVTFVELSLEAHRYRDAISFANGRELLLQRLREGQRVDVLSLTGADLPEIGRPEAVSAGAV
ncbi:MAG TPA: hypothetical protein VFA04_09995 [Bryobacteraceae bacterium]|nr:hypothetical protein [Bryobacteraceae bacterium]